MKTFALDTSEEQLAFLILMTFLEGCHQGNRFDSPQRPTMSIEDQWRYDEKSDIQSRSFLNAIDLYAPQAISQVSAHTQAFYIGLSAVLGDIKREAWEKRWDDIADMTACNKARMEVEIPEQDADAQSGLRRAQDLLKDSAVLGIFIKSNPAYAECATSLAQRIASLDLATKDQPTPPVAGTAMPCGQENAASPKLQK